MNHIYDHKLFFNEYAKMARSQKGLASAGEWPQLQPLFPDLTNKKVLDLGCGYGWHCKYAIEQCASDVLGIDASNKMIATARERNSHERITYQVCDLESYTYPPLTYDLVISNLVLHYIEDLEFIYKKVHQTLKKDGVFLFNIEHPVFTSGVNQDWIYDKDGKPMYWAMDHYFYPGERETSFLGQNVIKQHHTLTQILNELLKAGFKIDTIEEAMPPKHMMDITGMEDELRRPMMLLVRASK